jgi:formylglycine-generating enzyme required for sulfatase activity
MGAAMGNFIDFKVSNPMAWVAGGAGAVRDALKALGANYKPPFECPDGMKPVLGGGFEMGSTDGFGDEGPVHDVELSSFCLDRSEITVRTFDSKCPGRRQEEGGYSLSDRPAIGMDWYAADECCKAMGKRLPTEAEWEFAARGFSGNEYMDKESISERNVHYKSEMTANVCTYETNGLGLCDMIGNASEWVADWYGPYDEGPVKDPSGFNNGDRKVIRGGGCRSNDSNYLRASNRFKASPGHFGYALGFRCAADPIKTAR